MNKLTAALVLTLIATFFVVGCHRDHAVRFTTTHLPPIVIYTVKPGECDVSASQATGHISLGHRFTWQSGDRYSYTVVFRQADGTQGSGTPFRDPHDPTKLLYSFPVTPSAPAVSPIPYQQGYFEYGINDQAGKLCKDPKDPGLIVKG
jgi:hypothetical protein